MSPLINRRYILICIITQLSVIQDAADFQMSMFTYYKPPFKCLPDWGKQYNVTISTDQCSYEMNNKTLPCREWSFDKSQIKSTLVTDLKLICSKRYLELMLIPLRDFACMSIVFIGFLADRYGRKTVFVIISLLDTIFWILIGVIPTDYSWHLLLRILKSMVKSSMAIGYVLISELTPHRYRNVMALNYWVIFGVGLAIVPVYVKFIPYWKKAWMVAGILNCYSLFAPFVLLESPKWLYKNNKIDKARHVMTLLNQYTNENEFDAHMSGDDCTEKSKKEIKSEFRQFITSPILLTRFAVLSFSTFSFLLIYQGLATNLTLATKSIYLTAFLLGVMEIPTGVVAAAVSHCVGPINALVGMGMLGAALYVGSPVHWSRAIGHSSVGQIVHTVLICITKVSFISAWNIQTFFYVTLSPTNLRNSVFAISNCIGILGACLGAFIGQYFDSGNQPHKFGAAIIIYTVLLLASLILIGLIIPSTKNVPLPNTVEEAKMIKKMVPCQNNQSSSLDYEILNE